MFRLLITWIALTAIATAKDIQLTPLGAGAYALAHHPSLAAARLRLEEARGRLEQSGRLSNPELEFDFTRHTSGREGSFSVAFTQRFPLTARLRHAQAVSRAELAAADAEVRDAGRKLAADASAAAVRLLTLRGQRDLRTRQLGNSRELSSFLLQRVGTGEASAVDAAQVELESRQIEVDSLQLAADETVLVGELRSLLGLAGQDHVTMTGALPAPAALPADPDADVSDRPDILAAASRVEAARSVILEARARRWEDVGLSASYARDRERDEPEPIETDQIVGFRFSLPLPIWNGNSGRLREAEAASLRAAKELEAIKLAAGAEVTASRAAMAAYARLLGALDDQVLPTATRIEDQLRSSYSTGQTPLTDVLRARTRRLELQRQRLDALREYHLARIRHAAALGHPPRSNFSNK